MSDVGAIERFYGRWAGLYDVLATRTPGIRSVRLDLATALELPPGATVVEMGCGTGANFPHLRARVGERGHVVGVDLTPGMLERARRRIRRNQWRNVHAVRGDATRPPIGSADAVLGTFVVGMLDDPAEAVNQWVDIVGSGGRIALLDAAPRDTSGVLDAAFRCFVAISAPPTWRVRYDESPAESLGERIDLARDALATQGDLVAEERFGRGFLRLSVLEVE